MFDDEFLARFWANVEKKGDDDCWEWSGYRDEHGYGRIKFHQKALKAYRVSFEIAFGAIPEGYSICHHCDNPPCVNPSHLFAGTVKDNVQDMIAKGRAKGLDLFRQKAVRYGKLTREQVTEIRTLYHKRVPGHKLEDLANKFGVAQSTISLIVNNITWR